MQCQWAFITSGRTRLSPRSTQEVRKSARPLALGILDHACERKADRDLTLDVVDITLEMLNEGQKRFRKTTYHPSERLYTLMRYVHSLVRLGPSDRVPCRECATAKLREIS